MTTLSKLTKYPAAYKASRIIYEQGPMVKSVLFSKVDFGVNDYLRNSTLTNAIDAGWLQINAAGSVDLTEKSFACIDKEIAKERREPTGSVATPRQMNVYERPAYVPPKRVIRADAPVLYPAGFRLHTIA